MNICVFKESLCLGGTERSAANISKILEKDHNVYFAVYDGSKTQYGYGGKLIDFKAPAKKGIIQKVFNNVVRFVKYKRLINKNKIDILFEFISINNPISTLKHKNKIRIISSRDFSVLENFSNRFHKCLSKADAMICNSKYLRDFYVAKYPQHTDRVFAVYNVIDTDDINRQATEQVEPEFDRFLAKHKNTVVSVGRFCKEKGFEYLIEAISVARQKDETIGFVLVGDGEYLNRYQDVIEKYNLKDHIYLTGFQKNPYKYMAKCTCFILSSLSEGFPNVLAEAMALSLPVIATNCLSGPAEILRDDGDYNAITDSFVECDYGIITPRLKESDNDTAILQLSQAINLLLSDEEKLKKYSVLSKQKVVDFSKETAQKQLNDIFDNLVQRRGK